MLLVVADNNGRHFGHHCCRRVSPISIKHRGQHDLIIFHINFIILLKLFDGGIGKIMQTAVHPTSGVDSSNPHRWRGELLHHHGDVVC